MFTVVIPTYHEGKYIGGLLKSIKAQTLQPAEIIVADRPSNDDTREIAKNFGCKVVEGGIIPVGRNNGAKAAKSEILVFMDADCQMQRHNFFNKIIGEFISSNLDIASCFTHDILEKKQFPMPTQISINVQRVVNLATSKLFKKIVGEAGACIICKKSVFERLHGFNENMKTMEDSNFFQKAIEKGYKYGVIPVSLGTSNRRFASRPIKSSIKIATFIVALSFGTFLGIKGLGKLKKKYDTEKGEMGGKTTK